MREEVVKKFKEFGINPNEAIEKVRNMPISIQCWQLDDIDGFLKAESLTGGIQSTGNYPFKARNFEELTSDLKEALKFIPGKKKVNLHAIYESDALVDRSEISAKNFRRWIEFAKENNIGIDFNPTCFASEMLKDNLTLSSYDENVRNYWIKHCVNSIKTSEDIARELNQKVLVNIWVPDGLKESPSNRIELRKNLKNSLDKILDYKFDRNLVDVSVESKVFGIGVESFTVGSFEFYLSYAKENNLVPLLDMGHFHPTENVSDKISSLLLFFSKIALHTSRGVRWDSDHVLKLNDELQEVCDELVKNDAFDRTYLAMDFFDGSINRVDALIIGARNLIKALIKASLTPWKLLGEAQKEGDHTKILYLQEKIKELPWEEVYEEYLKEENIKNDFYEDVKKYEKDVMSKRGN